MQEVVEHPRDPQLAGQALLDPPAEGPVAGRLPCEGLADPGNLALVVEVGGRMAGGAGMDGSKRMLASSARKSP